MTPLNLAATAWHHYHDAEYFICRQQGCSTIDTWRDIGNDNGDGGPRLSEIA